MRLPRTNGFLKGFSRAVPGGLVCLGTVLFPWAASAQAQGAKEEVVSLCLTSQGNGFNWASSLAWLSESYEDAARVANAQAARGIDTRFDVACAAGSSSAAGTVALLAALLNNPSLGWSTPTPAPARLTAADLDIAARALRLLALATDFGGDEKAAYTARYLLPEDDGKGEWWKSQYGADLIRNVFARRIHLASKLRAEDLWVEIDAPVPAGARARTVTDLLEFAHPSAMPVAGSPEAKAAERFLRKQQDAVGALVRKRLGLDVWAWNARANAFLAQAPVPDGFLTTAFALVEPVQADGRVPVEPVPPAFPRARKVVFANGRTLATLLGSQAYQDAVDVGEADTRNFVSAEVTSLADLLRVSQAEPENQALLTGSLGALGIRGFHDPREDSAGRFALEPRPDLGLVVLGGWTNPETSAWPLTLYQFAKVSQGARAVSLRFGKPGRTATFPLRVLGEYFFRNADGSVPTPADANAASYLDAYYADMDAFEATHAARAARLGVAFETRKATFNWDIAKRPAAAASLSQELLLKTVNALRSGRVDAQGRPLPLVYDPLAAP